MLQDLATGCTVSVVYLFVTTAFNLAFSKSPDDPAASDYQRFLGGYLGVCPFLLQLQVLQVMSARLILNHAQLWCICLERLQLV